MTVNKTTKIGDKGTNNQDPTTNHRTDQISTVKIAPNKQDSRMHKAIKIDNGCKIDSSQKGDWTYKYRKQRNKRLVKHKGTTKGCKILGEPVHKVGTEHKV